MIEGAEADAPEVGKAYVFAIRYVIQRQAAIVGKGGTITQETRHWHEDTGVTSAGRLKSDADDYSYFPEPDLLPVEPSAELIETAVLTDRLASQVLEGVIAVEGTPAQVASPVASKWYRMTRLSSPPPTPLWRLSPTCSSRSAKARCKQPEP